jgi:hypothetical protein
MDLLQKLEESINSQDHFSLQSYSLQLKMLDRVAIHKDIYVNYTLPSVCVKLVIVENALHVIG